jgi:putative radical SAM enzyme (TIGR03279 family)
VARTGVRIRIVEEGSAARAAGLAPGDQIVAVNGHSIPDELALKFHLAEERVELEVVKADGREARLGLDLSDGTGLGVEVEDFRTRTCNNDCLFCFINQLPSGTRPSLQIKDDDYRLSFLHGNYITLTNLPERELDRIIAQALSPLYVSVHATDAELRTRILGRRKPDDLAGKLRKLIDGGIRIHAQVVLMPGINDGANLARTVFDLYGYHPGVDSIAIVPLGLSAHGVARESLTPVAPRFCREVIRQVTPWRKQFRKETGRGFAYLADEIYLLAGRPIPRADYYDDFAQIEDGVGMVRRFLDDFACGLERQTGSWPGLRGTLATGMLFSPFLRDCVGRVNRRQGSRLEVAEVENRFMGRTITVAGLLAGRDFASAFAGKDPGDFVVVPGEALSKAEGIFVDDLSPAGLAEMLQRPVFNGGRQAGELFRLLQSLA